MSVVVSIVVPVYNEATDLEPSVRRLRTYLDTRFPFPARITISAITPERIYPENPAI